MFLTYSSAKSS